MKKIITLFLVIFISCGPSEEEIQARIDNAVEQATSTTSSTTTSSTTTTTIERVEWTPSEINLTCPSSRNLNMGEEFNINWSVKFGHNPRSYTVMYTELGTQEIIEYFTATSELDPVFTTWEKDFLEKSSLYTVDELPKDYKYFYYSVEIKDSAGSHKQECEINSSLDFDNLPPVINSISCPDTVKQGERAQWDIEVISRTNDVSYIEYETIAMDFDDLIIQNDEDLMPERDYRYSNLYVYWDTSKKSVDYNIVFKATVYDTKGLNTTLACGVRAER